MIPILFDASATEFSTNGIGRLNCISCTVREELNGIYELDMEYPATGPRFNDLVVSNIILAKPYDGADPEPFRIYAVSKEMHGRVVVSARHISYQLNWIPVTPFNYSSLADCLAKLKSNSVYTNPFTFWTDKEVTTGGAFTEPLPCRSTLSCRSLHIQSPAAHRNACGCATPRRKRKPSLFHRFSKTAGACNQT